MNNKLTCNHIRERQRNLVTDSYISNPKHNIKYLFESLSERYSWNNAKLILENWRSLSETEIIAFDRALEVFGYICDNDNESNIRNATNIIEGNIIPKVRDGKATRHLNNYKLGKFKIQHTKAENHNKDNANAVQIALQNKGYLPNNLHPNRKYKRDIYGNKMGEEQKRVNNTEEDKKEKTIKECFEILEEATWRNEQCDRVIKNHNILSRKFNIDSIVRSCTSYDESYQDCIYELCSLIDTCDIAFGIKYNIALENILFLMNKNCIKVSDRFIIENVTDYFLLSRETTPEELESMDYILSISKFFTNEDVDYARILFSDIEPIETDDEFERIIHEGIEKDDIKKMLNQFKKSNKKTIEGLRACITRIFVKPPELIIRNLPDIFAVIRTCVVLGLFLINPVVGLIGTITGYFLKLEISRKEMDRVIDQYYKEKERYQKKKNNAKDENTKEKYKKLIKQLDSDISKLEDFADDLYTEKDADKRKEDRYARQYASDDDDFGLDFDFDFEESTQIELVEKMATLFESVSTYNTSDLMATIRNSMDNISGNDIYRLTESIVLCNDIFDCPEYMNILEDTLLSTRLSTGIQRYGKIDSIHWSKDEVEKVKYDDLLNEDYSSSHISTIYEVLLYKTEVVDDTLEYIRSVVNEGEDKGMSFMSKLNIAKENLKRTANKLKDKDRELSKKLDNNVDLFTKSAKNAMISDNREAIIKGKLLPSASKCVHLALATGLAWLLNPVIAVIGVLGYIGTSKHLQEKERRLIFDEIEVEIEMCDKYLRIAEDKNDMKAVRNIMQTKRALERQRQRLRNGMGTEYKKLKNIYDPKSGVE